MPKPWAKYDSSFINHAKFQAIPPAAIGLWLEGKCYADTKFTDGILPTYAVQTWRFYSKANVRSLTTSCGQKGDAASPWYAPLWDVMPGVGWKMHDYLDWNDSRDVTVQRIFEQQVRATAEKKRHADRMQKWRDAKAAKDAAGADVTPPVTPIVTPPVTVTETEKSRHGDCDAAESAALHQYSAFSIQQEPSKEHTHVRARGATLTGNEHRAHAECGRVCVPAFLHRSFRASLGGNEEEADQRLRDWYGQVLDALPPDEPCAEDSLKFWRPQFQAQFVKPRTAGKTAQQETDELLAEIRRQDAAGKA